MDYREKALDFVKEVWGNKNVLEVVLYGSVARGEESKDSDIDLFIVLEDDSESDEVEKIARETGEDLELTFSDRDFSDYDESFISDVYGEGVILFSRESKIKVKGMELKPKALVSFSLKNLDQSEKTKVNRALYGRRTKSKYKGKEYVSESKGFVPEEGKLGSGTVLVDKQTFQQLRKTFERFGVTFKKYDIWL